MVSDFDVDSARSRSSSPILSTAVDPATTAPYPSTSPVLLTGSAQSGFSPEPTPSRQRRLLQSRNAKFPAKQLSLSNLGSKYSQLVHVNDEPQPKNTTERNKENARAEYEENGSLNKGHLSTFSLGVLDDITDTNRDRQTRQNNKFSLHRDTSERPLLDRSPFSSPVVYQDYSSRDPSPTRSEYFRENLSTMRLREISGNSARCSPTVLSPSCRPNKALRKRKSMPIKSGFDTLEYIEHIEKELQDAKNEMFSPATNKQLKDQLKTARHENDGLKAEMTELRSSLEFELKRALEQKAAMEAEWRRQVRDLEDELEQKTSIIGDLEQQHHEKRLDSNMIDTLKATIDKLEQDKISLEDENRSMTKRNEVLSELLAMSPSKTQHFELRSPVRERRAGRPMSMIIPRVPLSPGSRQVSQPTSAVASPDSSLNAPFFSQMAPPQHMDGGFTSQGISSGPVSRRSTLQSQSSVSPSIQAMSRAPTPPEDSLHRPLQKRKTRKFLPGSTQLKPLLLPTLTSDTVTQTPSSTTSTPFLEPTQDLAHVCIDTSDCCLSQSGSEFELDNSLTTNDDRNASRETVVKYQNLKEILANHESPVSSSEPVDLDHTITDFGDCGSMNDIGEKDRDGAHSSYQVKLTPEVIFQPKPYSSPVDMEALNSYDAPTLEYDRFSASSESADEDMVTNIPQPLFSPHISKLQSMRPLHPHKAATNFESFSPRKPLCSSHRSLPIHQEVQDSNASPVSRIHMLNLSSTLIPDPQTSMSSHSSGRVSVRSELPQRSTLRATDNLSRTRSPLEILQHGKFGARPLASVTIKALFNTVSRCTALMHNARQDPFALARRVMANAWLSNWTRFGKLSWWVLGLFITPSLRNPRTQNWEWDQYDGEAIAERFCGSDHEGTVPHPLPYREMSIVRHSSFADPEHLQQDATDVQKPKVGWGHSMILWGKFSMAIMLAVGGAVVKGPGEMLKDLEGRKTTRSEARLENPGTSRGKSRLASESQIANYRSSGYFDSISEHSRYRSLVTSENAPNTSIYQHGNIHLPCPPSGDQNVGTATGMQDSRLDDESTLKPFRSPRPHIAGIFLAENPRNISTNIEDTGQRSSRGRVISSSSRSSVGDAFLRWPPSPGPIHPPGHQPSRGNNLYSPSPTRSETIV